MYLPWLCPQPLCQGHALAYLFVCWVSVHHRARPEFLLTHQLLEQCLAHEGVRVPVTEAVRPSRVGSTEQGGGVERALQGGRASWVRT